MNILDKIDAYLLEKEVRVRDAHYPSDAYKCMRQLYYKWTGAQVTNDVTAGQVWKMEMGNAVHEMLIRLAKESGIEINEEISGEYRDPILKYPIRYRVDGIFFDEQARKGMEAKSTFGRGIKEIYDNMKPRSHDLKQIVCYAYLTGIACWHLVYIGRDNGYRTQFRVEYDSAHDNIEVFTEYANRQFEIGFGAIRERWQCLERHLEAKEVPFREYFQAIVKGEYKDQFQRDRIVYKTDWQCGYCPFRDLCWEPIRQRTTETNLQMWEERDE